MPSLRQTDFRQTALKTMKHSPSQNQPLIQSMEGPFQAFTHAESTGGVLLLAATTVALLWANSPWADAYTALWSTPVSVAIGSLVLTESLTEWINEGLMAMFFFVIGLEIKREVLVGELASFRQAALPLVAAVGGTLVPASLYWVFNAGGPGSPGWGIPMATDIAFALGILALLGGRVPLALKVFVAALAIVDDLIAVLAIALFYTSTISWLSLGLGAVFLVLLIAANVVGLRHPLVYSILGIGGLWLAFLLSGVHATIAGVLAAMTIPARTRLSGTEFLSRGTALLQRFEEVISPEKAPLANPERHQVTAHLESAIKNVETPLQRLEQALHPWVTVVVLPTFALANAGVALDAVGSAFTSPVGMGIIVGLLLGKPAGITLTAWLAIRMGMTTLPEGVTWRHLIGAGWLAGIGFTMSLFIASLAFGNTPLLLSAKMGILLASTLAGLVGWLLLRGIPSSADAAEKAALRESHG
jgi:NhaA family Na+:H+ antiporter